MSLREHPSLQRLLQDRPYRLIVKAVVSLSAHGLFAAYNAALGIASGSVIFVTSAIYYLLLSAMRFSAVLLQHKGGENSQRQAAAIVGSLLVILSTLFPVTVFFSMRQDAATVYDTIPMITIATYTFAKITTASITAYRHRRHPSRLILSINAIRYAEVAVSLMTMQQSMLVSFSDGEMQSATVLNACTGAGICLFILMLGIHNILNSRKEFSKHERSKNRKHRSQRLPESGKHRGWEL